MEMMEMMVEVLTVIVTMVARNVSITWISTVAGSDAHPIILISSMFTLLHVSMYRTATLILNA